MAQILDKQGLQHYANKMCNADNRKVGSKNLPTALNEIDIAIDGFKTLFETEYGTPVNMELENNENVFSIGTGINIDKKDDVENSFTDVELSGNSLVNLVSSEIKSMTSTRTSGWHQDRSYKYSDMIKPNTTYTIVCQVLKNTLSTPFGMGGSTKTYNQLNFNTFKNFAPKETGIKISVVQSYDEWDKTQALILFPQFGNRGEEQGLFEIGETIEYRFMIFEGDYSNNPPIDFFNGLKSIGEKEDGNHKISISSVGKNLFNINENPSKEINPNHNIKINDFNGYDIIAKNDNSGWIYSTLKHKIILKPNKDYRISCDIYKSNQNSKACIRLYSPSLVMPLGTLYSSGYVTFRTPSVVDDFYLLLYSSIDDIPCKSGDVFSYRNIQIEVVSDSNNDYSPFGIDKKEISLNEPLRGLPNGIRDTIEKLNGEWKIIRRCGEVILNDSLSYSNHKNDVDFDEYKISNFPINTIKQSSSISDKFPQTVNDRAVCSSGVVYIRFSKAREINTLEKCQQWFANNPTKIVYALETPIIEDVSPVTLQCWRNGTISINEVLPVETTHTVALNKSAQIQKNIEELTLLRNRVETLEKQYNNSTLNQAYELELLRLDMELDNIV